jgi:hypothetical protein
VSPELQARLAEIAARWEHGHDELTDGCALCRAEYAEAFDFIHAQPKGTP